MSIVTTQVPDELVIELDAVAQKLNRSTAWVIEHALKRYLEEREVEEQRWKETLEAIEEAERGEVVAGERVLEWLDTWGNAGGEREDDE